MAKSAAKLGPVRWSARIRARRAATESKDPGPAQRQQNEPLADVEKLLLGSVKEVGEDHAFDLAWSPSSTMSAPAARSPQNDYPEGKDGGGDDNQRPGNVDGDQENNEMKAADRQIEESLESLLTSTTVESNVAKVNEKIDAAPKPVRTGYNVKEDDENNEAEATKLPIEKGSEGKLASGKLKLNAVTEERDAARKQLEERDAKILDLTSWNEDLLEEVRQQDEALQAQDDQILAFVLRQNRQDLQLGLAAREIAKLRNCLSVAMREGGPGDGTAGKDANNVLDYMEMKKIPQHPSTEIAPASMGLEAAPGGPSAASEPLRKTKSPNCDKDSNAASFDPATEAKATPPDSRNEKLVAAYNPSFNRGAGKSSSIALQKQRRSALGNISNWDDNPALKSSLKTPGANICNSGNKSSTSSFLSTSSSKGHLCVKFAASMAKKKQGGNASKLRPKSQASERSHGAAMKNGRQRSKHGNHNFEIFDDSYSHLSMAGSITANGKKSCDLFSLIPEEEAGGVNRAGKGDTFREH